MINHSTALNHATTSSGSDSAAQETSDRALRLGYSGDAASDHRVCFGMHEFTSRIIVASDRIFSLAHPAHSNICGVCPSVRGLQSGVFAFSENGSYEIPSVFPFELRNLFWLLPLLSLLHCIKISHTVYTSSMMRICLLERKQRILFGKLKIDI
jgi:hypothetical protein